MPTRYMPKKISEIKKSDLKVSLVGKVAQTDENEFILQDETGQAKIASEEKIEQGNIIRVFCTIVDGNLKADTIQSLNGFDVNLYNKVRELYNKAGL